jgi:hypothetical protein
LGVISSLAMARYAANHQQQFYVDPQIWWVRVKRRTSGTDIDRVVGSKQFGHDVGNCLRLRLQRPPTRAPCVSVLLALF